MGGCARVFASVAEAEGGVASVLIHVHLWTICGGLEDVRGLSFRSYSSGHCE